MGVVLAIFGGNNSRTFTTGSGMKNNITGGLITGLIVLSATLSAHANLIHDGSFENTPVKGHSGEWQQFNSIDYWDSGNKIEIQTELLYGAAAEGSQYVELDSDKGDGNLWLTQTFATVVDQYYSLSFAFSPRPGVTENVLGFGIFSAGDNIGDWLVSGTHSANGKNTAIPDWQYFTYAFQAAGDYATIAFADLGGDNSFGSFLDDVAIQPVPEPRTLILFGFGIAGLAAIARKRKQ